MNNRADPPAASVLISCPECHSFVVRIPADRVSEHPKCPNCKAEVLAGRTIPLDAAAFALHTGPGRSSLPVLVDFWAPWCGPCHMMAPVLERIAQQRATSLQVGKVNTDEQPELASRFNIRSIPTLILFRDGQEIDRHSGVVDDTTLGNWLDGALAR